MRTGLELVEHLKLQPDGQLELWLDPDYVLRNTTFKPTGDGQLDREWLIYFWMHAYVPDGHGREETDFERYWKHYSNARYEYFKYARPEGYQFETGQSAIQLSTYQDEPLPQQLAELELWLPHIKPIMPRTLKLMDVLSRQVSIFEHTLSQYTSYNLYIEGELGAPAGKTHLMTGYGACVFTGTLPEAVAYVWKHHYYE